MDRDQIMRVLNDPIAQELIESRIPVRLAYTGVDGSPRVVPLAFHWNGDEFVICTLPHAPKVPALQRNPNVALTIDTESFPPHILLVRGTARTELIDGIPPEYFDASRKQVGAEGMPAFEAQVRGMYKQMVRISITPEWAKVMDFETRLPGPVETLLKQMSAG